MNESYMALEDAEYKCIVKPVIINWKDYVIYAHTYMIKIKLGIKIEVLVS